MNKAYSSLADWFEYLNADCDYEQWSQYLYGRLRGLGIEGGRGAELGCGSGAFTRAFARLGYDMTGFDVSPAMLARAEQLSRGIPHLRYGLADARTARLPGGKADFVLCVNDCLNYIPPAEIPALFRHVGGMLKKGGAFLFDVSSAYKLREVVGNNVFCEDRDEVAWMWFNKSEGGRVEMDITLFVRGEDGRFTRSDEHHTQYIHEAEDLSAAAEVAGFCLHAAEGALGSAEDKMRVNFICTKR